MAVIIDNPQLVETPAVGPLRYGVFTAATVTDDLSARDIAAGFQFAAPDCGPVTMTEAPCAPADAVAKDMEEGLPYMEGLPYWLYSTRQCGILGRTQAELSASVRRRLTGGEQGQVEAAIWGTGVLATTPSLTTDTGVVTVTPGAPGAGAAIAALEQSFYDAYGFVGTIHVNTAAYAALAYAELISDAPSAGVLRTPIGSLWSIGAGYGVDGPLGVEPVAGSVWAFMTPPVWIRRSTIITQDDFRAALDREFNQYVGLQERVYAHAWTCPVVHAVELPIAAPAVTTLAVGP